MIKKNHPKDDCRDGEACHPATGQSAVDKSGDATGARMLRGHPGPGTGPRPKAGCRYFPAFQAFVRSCLR